MADPKPLTAPKGAPQAPKVEIKPDVKPLKPPNPMWKYLGFGENFRPRLPSRNWLIFLSITGSFTSAVVYDKRETKRAQKKWCRLVEHIAKEPLDPKEMPRRLTVFLEGPPTDGLRIAQDHFKEYVKPILVASGLDWEFIQGRKEGDIRAELAEKIRNSRLPPDQRTEEDLVGDARRNSGIQEYQGPQGDIVIGRHTWKEYVRGLHEGWLGPLTAPPQPAEDKSPAAEEVKPDETESPIETMPGITINSTPREASPSETPSSSDSPPKPDEKPKKPPQPTPFITTTAYATAPTPTELPSEFDPSMPIAFPHVLGFLNTPKRLYRFLNRRVLADSIGRETAAIILATSRRTYHSTSSASSSSFTADSSDDQSPPQESDSTTQTTEPSSELQTALQEEEKEWHKTARKRVEGEAERTWLEPVILDSRIAARMRRAELSPEDEARARRIVVTEEDIEGWIKGGLRGLGRKGLRYVGFGGKEKEKKVVGVEGDESMG